MTTTRHSEEIEVSGHLVDSMILTHIFDTVMDMKGDFDVIEFDIGKRKTETSRARLRITADTGADLVRMLDALYRAVSYTHLTLPTNREV